MRCDTNFRTHQRHSPKKHVHQIWNEWENIFWVNALTSAKLGRFCENRKNSVKNRNFKILQNPELMWCNVLRRRYPTNFKLITAQMSSEMQNMWKSLNRSLWAYLMRCDANFRTHPKNVHQIWNEWVIALTVQMLTDGRTDGHRHTTIDGRITRNCSKLRKIICGRYMSYLTWHVQQSGITNCNYIHSPLIICHQDPIIKSIGDDKNNHRCVNIDLNIWEAKSVFVH